MFGPNDLYTKPYAIGPSVDVHLPWSISVEAGLLYERLREDITTGLIAGRGNGVNFGDREDLAGNQWLFPLLLKYGIARRQVTPFVEAGATLRPRHLPCRSRRRSGRGYYRRRWCTLAIFRLRSRA